MLAILVFAIYSGTVQATADAHWLQPEADVRPGQPIEVTCRTEWPASDHALDILPADPPSLDWGSLKLLRTESGLQEDSVHVDHVFSLTAAAAGTFRLPAISIPYLDNDSDDTETLPTIQAPPHEIQVRKSNRALYSAAIAATVTAILAAIMIALRLWKTDAQTGSQSNQSDPNLKDARAALNRAQMLRADGDFYGCYKAMVDAASAIGPTQDTLTADLTARAEAAGYGGSRPDDTILDSDFRAVDNAISQAEAHNEFDHNSTQHQNEVAKS